MKGMTFMINTGSPEFDRELLKRIENPDRSGKFSAGDRVRINRIGGCKDADRHIVELMTTPQTVEQVHNQGDPNDPTRQAVFLKNIEFIFSSNDLEIWR